MTILRHRLPPHAAELLAIFGYPEGADIHDLLWWRTDPGGSIVFYANCSDVFTWGTADSEPILPDDMPLLRQSLDDLRGLPDYNLDFHLADLYVARRRSTGPGPHYFRFFKGYSREFQELFPPPPAGRNGDE